MPIKSTAFTTPCFPSSLTPQRTQRCSSSFAPIHFAPIRLARRPTSQNVLFRMSQTNPSDSPAEPNTSTPPLVMTLEAKELRSVLRKCSLFIIGPMGSGKSVVGKYLAHEIAFRFLDIDHIVEQAAEKTINEIFKEDGEPAFRDLESCVLEQVTPFIACVISTGGGVVVRKENWGKLQTGIVIYLKVQPDVLADRLQGETKQNRPLLRDADAHALQDRLNAILEERRHLYEQADLIIPVNERQSIDDVGKDIVRKLTNFIKANPPRLSTLHPGKTPNS